MPRKRLSRRELVEKDDITTGLESVTGYVVEHGRTIGITVVIVVVAAAAFASAQYFSRRAQAGAEEALGEVIRVYARIDQDGSGEERFQATLAEAVRVQTEHPNQPASEMARYYEALAQKGLGNAETAADIFNELANSGTGTVNSVARFGLAELYKEQGQLEQAVAQYRLLADSRAYVEEAVLYELGRLHELMAMPEEARGYYQSLVGEYPNSSFRVSADRALRRLAQADAGQDS